jgi:hypothetical protein
MSCNRVCVGGGGGQESGASRLHSYIFIQSEVCDGTSCCHLVSTPAAAPLLLLSPSVWQVRGDESMYEDDMSAPHEGAVWLMGEQRWSKPRK